MEQSGVIDKNDDENKIASTKIKIGAEIGLSGLIKAGIRFAFEKCKIQGNEAHAVTQGDWAHAVTQGNEAHAVTQGNRAHAAVSGQSSVAAALGRDSKAKACIGSAIVLSEYDDDKFINIKAAIIDGEKLKADTFYILQNGEFIEVDD